MKWLHREILNSRTYQLSWIPNSTNRLDERNFSHAVPRRLPAEIVFDMMTQATLNDAKNAAFVTDVKRRAVAIPGAAIKARNGNPADYALTVFGRSVRDTNCDCDRTEVPSLLQTIFIRNDQQLLSMIDSDNGWLVSRFPDPDELNTAQTYIAQSKDPVDGVRGVIWALLNTREFVVNH